MTSIADVQVETKSEVQVVADAPARREVARGPRTRRQASLIVVGVIAVLAVYSFFSAFVTHLWFDSRQRALAGEGISFVKPRTGVSVGVLQAQGAFDLNVQVVQGDGTDELYSGPGHRVDTPLPGAKGNSVVYGRADEWGAPFRHLALASKGTELYLRTPAGNLLGYVVRSTQVVPASELGRFIGPSDDYRLTLVTDARGRFSDLRRVVVAVSGTVGQLSPAPPGTRTGPDQTSPVGLPLAEMIGWALLTGAVVWLLRRSHSRPTVVAAASPLAVATLVAAFLELGLLWSPLT